MGWFKRLFGGGVPAVEATPARPVEAQPAPPRMQAAEAWAAHGAELQNVPGPQQRGEILMAWRQKIDQDAHDYADLVIAHPKREQIMQLEVEAIMQAYLYGYMARRGWIEEMEARQAPFLLGRGLRDRVRALGVSFDSVSVNLGTTIDKALDAIVQMGLKADT